MADHLSPDSLGRSVQPGEVHLMSSEIPGGIFRCYTDTGWTILDVSRGFLNLFGYTTEDIQRKFQNKFLEMIDPRDRAAVMESLLRQSGTGKDHRLEYRVKHCNGQTLWILEQGRLTRQIGEPDTYCCILADITESKNLEEKLRLSLERHQIIMDQTDDIIIEWNIETDSFICSPKWERKFGYMPSQEKILTRILRGDSHIHPDDQARVVESLYSIRKGAHYADMELRIRTADDRYLWCRARLTAQISQANHPIHAIGVLIDIDNEKRQAEKLLEIAQHDSLTGLYNKGTSQKRIEEHLKSLDEHSCSALMILDLDNFKQINDSMGHLFGDAILIEAAQRIKKQFRSTDIVGRIGGDEFIIFMEHLQGTSILQKKAEQVIHELEKIQTVNNGTKNSPTIHLSCSVGAAVYPLHGKSFKELYHNADLALYQAKKNGKNQYHAYDTSSTTETFLRTTAQPVSYIGGKIDSDEPDGLLDRLAEHCFRILYQAHDVETAVQSILEMVGKKFNVSRAYIFENSEDGTHCCNTFEWCNEGISPQIENLQSISYEEDLNNRYLDNFNEDGIFYCRDICSLEEEPYAILAPQGIKSLLQSAIYDNGVFQGFVGFDDCSINRFWTQDQVDALAFISEILSVFLLKHRAQQKAMQARESLCTMLDNQNSWIYLVDPKSFELLYINRGLSSIFPNACIGKRCYESFFQQGYPCADCPVQRLSETQNSLVLEIYQPLLNSWLLADASLIPWRNEPAALVCCCDITKYKK